MAKHANATLIFDDVSPYIDEIKSLRKAVSRYKKKAARANDRADKNLALYRYTLSNMLNISNAIHPAMDWLNSLTKVSSVSQESLLFPRWRTPGRLDSWFNAADAQQRRGHAAETETYANWKSTHPVSEKEADA